MDTGSKKLIAGGVAAVGCMFVMAGAVVGAGVAKADPDTYAPWSGPLGDHSADAYWLDVIKYGGTGSVADAANLAHVICTALDSPKVQDGDLIVGMADGLPTKVPDVTLIVHAAEWHFCPNHYGQ